MSDRVPAAEPGRETTAAETDVGVEARVSPGVVVRIPGPLRGLADGAAEVTLSEDVLSTASVGSAMETLVARHPGLRRHLLDDDGSVRDYVNIFVGDDDIRYLDGVATTVDPGAVITIVPSIAGG